MPAIPANALIEEDDEQFWNSLTEHSTAELLTSPSTPPAPESQSESDAMSADDTISNLYLTLLHTTTNKTSPSKSRAEHDRAVNTLASDILWPLIVDQTNRRSEKRVSSSTATTIQSISSPSSTSGSSVQRRMKKFSSTSRSRRPHPYSTTQTWNILFLLFFFIVPTVFLYK